VFFEKSVNGFGGLFMFYECGGRFETPKFRGMTHLAEHLACKGEKKYQKEVVMNSFDTNAMTGDNYVCFYFSGLEDLTAGFVEKYLSCRNYIPPEEEFETEKLIIEQEVQSALCNNTLAEAFNRGMFDYSGPCGDIDAIKALSYQDFLSFYKEIYSKPSVVVFSGGKNMEKAFKKFGTSIEFKKDKRNKQPISMFKQPDTTKYKVWSKKDSNTVLFFAEMKGKEKDAQISFLLNLLGDGFFSPFYQEIREEQKLCYYIYPFFEKYGKHRLSIVITETSKEKEFTDSLFNILVNFEKFVTKEYYENYIQKTITTLRQINLKGGYNLSYYKYCSDEESFFNTFDQNSPLFSYEAMKKLAKKLAKRSIWKKMSHYQDNITFTETV